MATRKLPKAPKKPKASASITVKENYLKRRKEWEKKVNAIKAEKKKSEQLTKKINGLK